MAVALGLPRWRAFDADGDPLAGGKLYTYQPGGAVTPKASYTDAEGVTANANPVVLDANGEADIWLDGNYYLVLTDAADVSQWTVDNYPSVTTSSALPGLTFGSVQVTLSATDFVGTGEMRATAALPANSVILGVPREITATFSTENGLTGLDVGDDSDQSRWGSATSLVIGSVTDAGDFSSTAMRYINAAQDLVIRSVGGTFGATGTLIAYIQYQQITARPTTVDGAGVILASSGFYAADFLSVTSLVIPNAVHGLNTADILVQLYNNATPRAQMSASAITVHPSTFAVTITFGGATSGRVLLAPLV